VAVGLVKTVPFFFQHVLTAAVIGIAAGTLSNFSMSRRWVFGKPVAAVNREDSI
jgi:putative flippase GtrA